MRIRIEFTYRPSVAALRYVINALRAVLTLADAQDVICTDENGRVL